MNRVSHIYQFVRAMVVMADSPLKPFKDKPYTPLEVQSAKIDAIYAICYQFPYHADGELDPVVFHQLIVMLQRG